MRCLRGIGVLLVSMALVSCGAGDSSSTSGSQPPNSPQKPQLAMSKAEIAKLPKLTIGVPSGPPPKKLVITDLRKGSGAAVTAKDKVLVKYFSVKYGEALRSSRTGHYGPSEFGLNEVVKGWKLGLPGMKVGGRRELTVPPRLGYRGMTLIYVIDLLAVNPPE